MASKLVECDHCKGKKMCTYSGGKSCRPCLEAAGTGRRQWATVRCSYCGGRGKVWVKEEDTGEEAAVAAEGEEGAAAPAEAEEEKPAEA